MFWKKKVDLGTAKIHHLTGCPFTGDNIILGSLPGAKLGPNKFLAIEPKQHALTIAATRTGKSVTQIATNLLKYKGSAVVVDPKGEIAFLTSKARRFMGQKIILLDPWGEVRRRYDCFDDEIASYNLLEFLDIDSPKYVDDLNYIVNALIISQSRDPHWDNSAKALSSGLMDYLIRKGHRDLTKLRELLCLPNIVPIAQESARDMPVTSVARRRLAQFLDPDSKENSSIMSAARQQTLFLDSPILGDNLSSKSTFKMEDLENGATIYIILPVEQLEGYGRWLRIIITEIIKTLARCTKTLHPKPLIILDEFGTIGALDPVKQAFGLMAGLNMFLWGFLQDLNQLQQYYPKAWGTFIANAQVITLYSIMDLTTGEYFSKMLGGKTIKVPSRSYSHKPGDLFERVTRSEGYQNRALRMPDELRLMPGNKGLAITTEYNAYFDKYPYYKDRELARLARKNPYY